jgi:hypothetical protein
LPAHLDYLQVLGFLSRHGESFFANNSINGILNGYLSPSDNLLWTNGSLTPFNPIVYAGTTAASVLTLAAIVLPPLLGGKRRPDILDLAAASILTVIGSPVAWEHHYGIFLPIYCVVLKYLLSAQPGRARALQLVCLAVSWVFVADFIPFANLTAHTPFSFVQAHLFFGALLLLALIVGCMRQRLAVSGRPAGEIGDRRALAVAAVPGAFRDGALLARQDEPGRRSPHDDWRNA